MSALEQIGHIVVLMLENRSFDHMLGFLYTAQGNKSPAGQPFEQRWNLPALTARDAAAQGVGAVLTLQAPRTDDPLQGVTVPQANGRGVTAY